MSAYHKGYALGRGFGLAMDAGSAPKVGDTVIHRSDGYLGKGRVEHISSSPQKRGYVYVKWASGVTYLENPNDLDNIGSG